MSDAKSRVEQLSKDGVSLHAIIMSGQYSEVVRVEALRVLHMNVRGLGQPKESVLEAEYREKMRLEDEAESESLRLWDELEASMKEKEDPDSG